MSEFKPRPTERQAPCPGCHPDRPDPRCALPDGHVVHWDGQREIWLSPTVADDLALAAAESRGWDKAVAALRDMRGWAKWCADRLMADGVQTIDLRQPTEPADYLAAVKAEVLGGETT